MRNHLLAALGSKVVVGVAATTLAFGTAGAVLVLQPVSDSKPSESGGPFVAADETTTTTSTTSTSTTSTTVDPTTTTTVPTDDHDADDDHAKDGSEVEHDNFGARVSADAHDGGVDGQEISAAAHKRNDARKTQHNADHAADHEDNGGSGRDHTEDD
ncbi:MAG: hypothetical protein JWN29_656 [Acidimicrobiales bacterium]|jgi:hypothetical protein|nr:hypothetical protein [Acidimicrobiales bacterium]